MKKRNLIRYVAPFIIFVTLSALLSALDLAKNEDTEVFTTLFLLSALLSAVILFVRNMLEAGATVLVGKTIRKPVSFKEVFILQGNAYITLSIALAVYLPVQQLVSAIDWSQYQNYFMASIQGTYALIIAIGLYRICKNVVISLPIILYGIASAIYLLV